jgi:hypothetical protein
VIVAFDIEFLENFGKKKSAGWAGTLASGEGGDFSCGQQGGHGSVQGIQGRYGALTELGAVPVNI